MIRAAQIAAFVMVAALASSAEADESPVQVTLEPWAAFDGVERPYRYIVTLRASAAVEVVADRRLLSFEVRPEGSRRRHRCRYPGAPSRPSARRVRSLAAGQAWREWIDLRMYCWGRSLGALRSGGEVRARYGWRRRSRSRWIARVPETAWRGWTGGVDAEPFRFAALAGDEASAEASGTPIRVTLSSGSARSSSSLRFRVAVRATEERRRLYLRPDSFRFRVRGGDEDVWCELPRGRAPPPVDLFRFVTARRAWRELLEAEAFCPRDTFENAGIYEVTPELLLLHAGQEWDLEAVTGTFLGEATSFRVTAGEGDYLDQVPERSDE